MTRLKLAELTSGVGALVIGIGLGALVPQWFSRSAGLLVIAGVVTHAFGMWDKHRLDAQRHVETGRLVVALYWACWLLLAGVVVFLLVER
jgi:uncharacterized membrane protein YidH (DUF202 family)